MIDAADHNKNAEREPDRPIRQTRSPCALARIEARAVHRLHVPGLWKAALVQRLVPRALQPILAGPPDEPAAPGRPQQGLRRARLRGPALRPGTVPKPRRRGR